MKRMIITTTHGDEQFSVPVVESLKQQFEFEWLTGNPLATQRGVRFIEADLNRVGPGKLKSELYEEVRAYEVIKMASKFDEVIDIHGTISDSGIFSILSDPNWSNIELSKKIDVPRVVLWPSLQPRGPLTQFIPNSLEIECGPKNAKHTLIELERILSAYLGYKKPVGEKEYFIVSGILKCSVSTPLKDFAKEKYKGDSFYPLMVDQYPGIKCYMLQKLGATLAY